MSTLEDDVASARQWLVAVGFELASSASRQIANIDWLLAKAAVVEACSQLPGDMALRVRLTPNAFSLTA